MQNPFSRTAGLGQIITVVGLALVVMGWLSWFMKITFKQRQSQQ